VTTVGAFGVDQAVERVAAGDLIAYPTETCWGLGADAGSERALGKLRDFKGRDAWKPLSLLVSGPEQLAGLGASLSPLGRRLAEAFWPGPLTLVMICTAPLADAVGREDGAVGFRCSSHPVARGLALLAERRGVGPLTATSLNHTGRPAARTRAEARALCTSGHEAPALVEGLRGGDLLECELPGVAESSVVDLTGPVPLVLRTGAVGKGAITAALEGGA